VAAAAVEEEEIILANGHDVVLKVCESKVQKCHKSERICDTVYNTAFLRQHRLCNRTVLGPRFLQRRQPVGLLLGGGQQAGLLLKRRRLFLRQRRLFNRMENRVAGRKLDERSEEAVEEIISSYSSALLQLLSSKGRY
jgi:hypothetical protein